MKFREPRPLPSGAGTLVVLALLVVAGWGAREARRAELQAARAAAAAPLEPEPRLSPAELDRAEAEVRAALERRAFPGAVLAMGVGERVERITPMGKIGWTDAAAPVSAEETLYDLASLTKAMATTTAVLMLAERGEIDLDAPVQRSLPGFEGQAKDRVTWRHLLTHTSGLPGGAVIRGTEPDERLRRLLRTRIDISPGTTVEYTDLGFLVLWAAAERVVGEPLEGWLQRELWAPLGMHATRFSPGEGCEACAPTLRLRDGTPYQGRPHDLYARRLGGVAGNAGLFSTAADMARFAAMIAGGGALEGVRVLREESVREMLRQQPGAGSRTLGWQAFCPAERTGENEPCARPVAYGHTGYTGTSLWVDPRTGAWAVLLSNRTYDVRNRRASQRIAAVREAVWEAAPGMLAEN